MLQPDLVFADEQNEIPELSPSPVPPNKPAAIKTDWHKRFGIGCCVVICSLGIGLGVGLGLTSSRKGTTGSQGTVPAGTADSRGVSNSVNQPIIAPSLNVAMKFLSTSSRDSRQRRFSSSAWSKPLNMQSADSSIEMFFLRISMCTDPCSDSSTCTVPQHCITILANPQGYNSNRTYDQAVGDLNPEHYIDITNRTQTLSILSKDFIITPSDIGLYTSGDVVIDKWVKVKGTLQYLTPGIATMYTRGGVRAQLPNPGGNFSYYEGTLTQNMSAGPAEFTVLQPTFDSQQFTFSRPFNISIDDFPMISPHGNSSQASNASNASVTASSASNASASSGNTSLSNITYPSGNTSLNNITYPPKISLLLAYETDNLIVGASRCDNFCPAKDASGLSVSVQPFSIAPIVYLSTEEVWKEVYLANMSYCGTGSTNANCGFVWLGKISVYYTARKGSLNGGNLSSKVIIAMQASTVFTELSLGVADNAFSFGCPLLSRNGTYWDCGYLYRPPGPDGSMVPASAGVVRMPLRGFSLLQDIGDAASFTYDWYTSGNVQVESTQGYAYSLEDRFVVSPAS